MKVFPFRRRWFQFSLLTMFLIVTGAGIFMGWYVNRVKPHLVLDGYCPVTLVETHSWTRGKAEFSTTFEGCIYHFASEKERQDFLTTPEKYAVVLGGYDALIFRANGEKSLGKRSHGVFYRDQIFLFTNEENLQEFWRDPAAVEAYVHKVQRR